MTTAPTIGFTEVADRVWVARYDWFDVNVVAVGGADGLLVVNTHAHFDHTFGNGVLAAEGAELVAHEEAAAALPGHAAQIRAQAAAEADEDPRYAEIVDTVELVPERTFSSVLMLDLGDRQVELVHPGRGHTSGDIVVRVPDAD